MTKTERTSNQRLGSFSWDAACIYPTPDEPDVVADPMQWARLAYSRLST